MLKRKECTHTHTHTHTHIYRCSIKEKSNYFNREKGGGPHIEGEVLVIGM